MSEKKNVNVPISPELHQELKIAVAQKGTTVIKFVTEAIREKVEKEKV